MEMDLLGTSNAAKQLIDFCDEKNKGLESLHRGVLGSTSCASLSLTSRAEGGPEVPPGHINASSVTAKKRGEEDWASSLYQVCKHWASSLYQVCKHWASSSYQVCKHWASSLYLVCKLTCYNCKRVR
jgi:hypothetical protein